MRWLVVVLLGAMLLVTVACGGSTRVIIVTATPQPTTPAAAIGATLTAAASAPTATTAPTVTQTPIPPPTATATMTRRQEIEQTREVVLEALNATGATTCEALTGTGIPGAGSYSPSPGVHGIQVVWDASNQRNNPGFIESVVADAVPTAWNPQTLGDVQLIACMSRVIEVVEECDYMGGADIERQRIHTNVRVIVAATGEVLGEQQWPGGDPHKCPFVIRTSPPEDITGPQVTSQEVVAWLQQFAAP